MRHGFTEQEWNSFVEALAEPALRGRIETHITGCGECAAAAETDRAWTEAIQREGQQLKQAMAISPDRLEAMLADSLARIAAQTPAAAGVGERLRALRALLSPLIGAGTARVVMEESGAALSGGISAANWSQFALRLGDSVREICGITPAMLATRAATALGIAESGGFA